MASGKYVSIVSILGMLRRILEAMVLPNRNTGADYIQMTYDSSDKKVKLVIWSSQKLCVQTMFSTRIAEHFGLQADHWYNDAKTVNVFSERVKLTELNVDQNESFRVRIIKGEMADLVDGLIVNARPKSSGETESLFLLPSGDALNVNGADPDTSGPETGSVEVASGRYASFVDLIDAIGDALKEIKVSDTHSLGDLVKLYYSPSGNKMYLEIKQMDQTEFRFKFSDRLCNIFDFDNNRWHGSNNGESWIGDNPTLDGSLSTMYIYSNIVQPRLVGDTSVRLLQVVTTQGNRYQMV